MAEQVLVPIDGSPQAWDALEYALATHPTSNITVLHVNDPMEWVYADEVGGYYSEEARERVEQETEELFEEVAEMAAKHDVDVTTVSEIGKPARVIVDYAEEAEVDHIIMGSHGRTGLTRILLGSVAELVVRRSKMPVTIMR